jgi:ribose/xylose/arabinose/galactoside ABC-type transport system permease subunit
VKQTYRERAVATLLDYATPLMFVAVFVYFGAQHTSFFAPESIGNIVKQASFVGIAAVGMIFVLLTAGIDLSVGSVMYLAPLIAGFAMREFDLGVGTALAIALVSGMALGAINAFFIVRLRIIPFIVTLATLFFFRGAGTFMTSSRQLDFPRSVLDFGQLSILGVPLPVIVFALVVLVAWVVLTRTQFGRQIYAIGNDADAARKAGINVDWVTARVYVISSACAALAGFVLIAQIGRLDQAFGEGREFDVIAAAVLGGTSLFGGIGSAFSAVVGATLIQTVKAGLVFTGVNLYLQPIVLGFIIFIAVLVDSLRTRFRERIGQRMIRIEEST